MGYTSCREWRTKSDVVRARLSEAAEFYTVLAHASTRSGLWYVVRPHRPDGKPFLAFDLMSRHGAEWGYKDMSVDMGPCEIDCPPTIIRAAVAAGVDLSEGYAADWLVRWEAGQVAAAAQRAQAARLVPGAAVTIYGKPYTLLSVSPMRAQGSDGRVYRVPKKAVQLA